MAGISDVEREGRSQCLLRLGFDDRDRVKWVDKWVQLKRNSKRQGKVCNLSFEGFMSVAKESELYDPDLIGRHPHDYCLARFGDVGPYEVGNCRFIKVSENLAEKQINGGTEAQADAIRGRTRNTHSGVLQMAETKSKAYRFISPDGVKYEGMGVTEFCRKHGLCQVSMSSICRNPGKRYKGWTGTYIDKEELKHAN